MLQVSSRTRRAAGILVLDEPTARLIEKGLAHVGLTVLRSSRGARKDHGIAMSIVTADTSPRKTAKPKKARSRKRKS